MFLKRVKHVSGEFLSLSVKESKPGGGCGGWVLPYKSYIGMRLFGLKTGVVFEGTTGVYERICLFSK